MVTGSTACCLEGFCRVSLQRGSKVLLICNNVLHCSLRLHQSPAQHCHLLRCRLGQHAVMIGPRLYLYGPNSATPVPEGFLSGPCIDWYDFQSNTWYKTYTTMRTGGPAGLPHQNQVSAYPWVTCFCRASAPSVVCPAEWAACQMHIF